MTKVLVVSDSHGNDDAMDYILDYYKNEIDIVVHCGDLEYPAEELKKRVSCPVYAARGNCDYFFEGDEEPVFEVEGHTCFVTHGNQYGVNWGTDELAEYARCMDADVVFFGHTHIPAYEEYDEGNLLVMNPGSISLPRQMNPQRTFLIVEFMEDGKIIPHFYTV